jgi:hypothetical protein
MEFMYFYEWVFEWFAGEPPFSVEFRILEGNIAYVALIASWIAVANSFAEKLSTIKRCSGLA